MERRPPLGRRPCRSPRCPSLPVGRENSDPSCCHRTVLVDETAEQVSSTDFIGGTGRHFLF